MAFIGNTNTTQAFTPAIDYFSGNGSTTAFTLSRPVASVAQVQVNIANVPQNPSTAYTISGNTITFTSAPLSGTNNIYVYYTSPITQVIAPGQGTVQTAQLGNITNIASGNSSLTLQTGTTPTTALTIDTSQNVGIGFSSPQGKLHVSGGRSYFVANSDAYAVSVGYSSYGAYYLGSNSANNALVFSNSAGTEVARIDTSGNVGIGVSSPYNKLAISGGITLTATYETYLVNAYYNSGWKYGGNGIAWGIGNNFGGVTNGVTIAVATSNAGGSGAALTWNPAFNIDSGGVFYFNSGYGSSAAAYGCRAWCNFDGTLTGTITPRANGGVTSVTKNATGDYTVNLSFTMPDINYSVALVGNGAYGVDRSCHPAIFTNISAATESAPTTTSFKVGFANAAGGAGQDLKYINVAVFR